MERRRLVVLVNNNKRCNYTSHVMSCKHRVCVVIDTLIWMSPYPTVLMIQTVQYAAWMYEHSSLAAMNKVPMSINNPMVNHDACH